MISLDFKLIRQIHAIANESHVDFALLARSFGSDSSNSVNPLGVSHHVLDYLYPNKTT
jgi:hypothetical protein